MGHASLLFVIFAIVHQNPHDSDALYTAESIMLRIVLAAVT